MCTKYTVQYINPTAYFTKYTVQYTGHTAYCKKIQCTIHQSHKHTVQNTLYKTSVMGWIKYSVSQSTKNKSTLQYVMRTTCCTKTLCNTSCAEHAVQNTLYNTSGLQHVVQNALYNTSDPQHAVQNTLCNTSGPQLALPNTLCNTAVPQYAVQSTRHKRLLHGWNSKVYAACTVAKAARHKVQDICTLQAIQSTGYLYTAGYTISC